MPIDQAVALTLAALITASGGTGSIGDGRIARSGGGTMSPGASGELSITILDAPAPGIPFEVRLDSDNVNVLDQRLGWADVVDPLAPQPRVRARLVAPAVPGRYRVDGLVTWVTCVGELCRTRRAPVAWDLEVVATADPAARGADAP